MKRKGVPVKACAPKKRAREDTRLAIVPYIPPVLVSDHRTRRASMLRKRNPREKIDNGPKPPPPIPTELQYFIQSQGGSELGLIIQKGLCKTDLSRGHNRLSMPTTLCEDKEFLPFLCSGNSVSVKIIDTKKRWGSVSVTQWRMKKHIHVIAGDWSELAAANDLKVKDVVQIWRFTFTETRRYGFAMVKLGDPNVQVSLTHSLRLPSFAQSSSNATNDTQVANTEESVSRKSSAAVANAEPALPDEPFSDIDLTLRLGWK